MNKFKFYFIVTITTLSLFSCDKNDPVEITPPRAYAEQYKTDIADIEKYLNTYYITVVNNPGKTDDQDVTLIKIPEGGTQRSIMSYLNATTFPKLLIRNVKLHDVDYKLYYLVLRPGIGESPCNVDGVFTSYRGDYLQRVAATTITPVTPEYISATKFEEIKFPQSFFSLYSTVSGWGETFPQFKKGTFKANADGSVSYYDFGAGVMFLPSGLAYYNTGAASIPAYSPLVFSFKLYEIQRLDQDNDGVPSFQEDLNGDNYLYIYSNTLAYPTPPDDAIRYADDTDKDGIPNFFDVDDDGDYYTTKLEITKPTDKVGVVLDNGIAVNYGPSKYYPFDAFTIIDDPLTTFNESLNSEPRGIPSYNNETKLFDYTTPNRLRIHLDDKYPIKP